jgi:hypothetical protein
MRMREIKEMEECIKNNWFANHKAKVTEHEGITILDWRQERTVTYSIRYIFCGSRLYISGDIGEAIFNLTWAARPESFNDVNLSYFLEKLSCHSRERWHFDEKKALNDLEEWYEEETFEPGANYLKETTEVYKYLKEIFKSVGTHKELERELFNYYQDNSFRYYDGEDFAIFSDFGKKLPRVFVAYLLGIKLANQQLAEDKDGGLLKCYESGTL